MTRDAIERSSLYARAKLFHRETWGTRCDCRARSEYPCDSCQTQVGLLCDLLESVVQDAIESTMRAKKRFGY